MDTSDKRVLGIVTAAIIVVMATALLVLRVQAIEHQDQAGQPSIPNSSGLGLDALDDETLDWVDAVSVEE